MAQHDYVIANGTGAAVRSDLNNGLAAIVSNNSGASEPTTMYAYQWWADTTTGLLKLRNSANNAWITLRQLDGEFTTLPVENGTAAAPSIYFKDSGTDTGFYSPGTDQVAISTGGTGRLFIDASGNIGINTSPSSLGSSVTTLEIKGGSTTRSGGLRVSSSDSSVKGAFYIYDGAGVLGTESATPLDLYTGNSSRLRITSAGLVGIGITAPQKDLQINAITPTIRLEDNGGGSKRLELSVNSSAEAKVFAEQSGSQLLFGTTGTERGRFDASGRFLVGTSTARDKLFNSTLSAQIQVEGTSQNVVFSGVRNSNDQGQPYAVLGKSRGTVLNSYSVVNSGDSLGTISFQGADGTELVEAASITAEVDGTPGANDMPGRLVFSTTADGASSPTERMRISSDGRTYWVNADPVTGNNIGVLIGATADPLLHVSRNAATPFAINRKTDDGGLIDFLQDGAVEGSIAVSGTTVSYNGAHLSRWSQLSNGAERIEILRGSVLSNLDEMCEWGDEDNEQLNRMKVSDVEGDKNVAGVFQSWDDDDDTYTDDFYCAMTGDFIIRIGAGTTVERGDLLMSAGDGTAKPQDDDIIRSKTIAKVTSTNMSCTYDDGSYCVPCVLMAC